MVHSSKNLALSARSLCKSYGNHNVLNNLELSVEIGAIHGLVGLNGSGKTTTLECILGLQPFADGDISLLGYAPNRLHEAAGRIVSIFDSPSLNPNLTVRQTLEHGALLCQRPVRKPAELETLLGIDRFSNFKIKTLSLGNKRRASIAQALLGKPELILLDEPFNGLDAGGVDDVLALIKQLNADEGTTFLLSSHQLPYLEQICSHLSILHQGKIIISDRVENLLSGHLPVALLQSDNANEAIAAIKAMAGVNYQKTDQDGFIHVELLALNSAELNRNLIQQEVPVAELRINRASLSTLFRTVTSESP
jgi:ABC-2 type transport system ATP-binding protein|tara:strand:- start:557 stop:1480 length:924 start_codon:yes stop_codon:yes gene_type:complete